MTQRRCKCGSIMSAGRDENRQVSAKAAELGWFMKALKEPLARLANKEDNCKGTFWESRFKSIAILDEEALLAICAYIDLNPVAAGIASTPETSRHTSVRQRVRHAKAQGQLEALKQAAAAAWPARKRRENSSSRIGFVHWSVSEGKVRAKACSRIFR